MNAIVKIQTIFIVKIFCDGQVHCMKKRIFVLRKFVKRTEKIIFLLVFVCFCFTEISYFLYFPLNENVRKQHLSASAYSCVNILSNEAKYLLKIFCQIKQNYTKNEHFIQQWSIHGMLGRNFDFWISYLLQVHGTVYFLTHLFLIIVPSMLTAVLKNFHWISSLFYLMFWILAKQL